VFTLFRMSDETRGDDNSSAIGRPSLQSNLHRQLDRAA
jgi:hypothetical protein